jgi:hypothetical protein
MNLRKKLLLSLALGVLSSNSAFSNPPFGGPIVVGPPVGGPMGGHEVGRNPNFPPNTYPIVVPYGYSGSANTAVTSSGPPLQGGSSVTNGNQTINANGISCVVNANGKKICN